MDNITIEINKMINDILKYQQDFQKCNEFTRGNIHGQLESLYKINSFIRELQKKDEKDDEIEKNKRFCIKCNRYYNIAIGHECYPTINL